VKGIFPGAAIEFNTSLTAVDIRRSGGPNDNTTKGGAAAPHARRTLSFPANTPAKLLRRSQRLRDERLHPLKG